MMLPGFDPSKMDPKVLMQLSQLIRELPPEQLSRMQTLMHNLQAGFDVRREMEEFERNLPPGFRERMMAVVGSGASTSPEPTPAASPPAADMDMRQARLTVLRAVSAGELTPEDAERLLFTDQ